MSFGTLPSFGTPLAGIPSDLPGLTPLGSADAAPPPPPQFTYKPISMEPDYSNFDNGSGNTSDYIDATGGAGSPYIANQTGYDVADNGLLTSTPTGTGSTSSLPSWLSSITSLGTAAGSLATSVAPIINGKPANPANPGAQPGANGTVAPATASSITTWIIGGLVVAVLAVVLFWKSRK